MTAALAQVILLTADVEAAKRFYAGLLGLPVEREEYGMAFLTLAGSAQLLLHPHDGAPPSGGLTLQFEVPDVRALVGEARGQGYAVVQEPIDQDYGLREAALLDSDGYKIFLIQPLEV